MLSRLVGCQPRRHGSETARGADGHGSGNRTNKGQKEQTASRERSGSRQEDSYGKSVSRVASKKSCLRGRCVRVRAWRSATSAG